MSRPVSQATLQAELPHRARAPLGRPSMENPEADPRRIHAEHRVSLLLLILQELPGVWEALSN